MYMYNSFTPHVYRFVKAEYTFGDPCQRDKPPNPSQPYVWGTKLLTQSYSTIYSQYTGFVGFPHFRALCRLLGYQGIAVVVEELLKVVSEQVSPKVQSIVSTQGLWVSPTSELCIDY